MLRFRLSLLAACCCAALASGCKLIIPTVAHEPVIRNPFPQLRRVAIAPFFNLSDEPTVDGRQVAMSYFAELQTTQGFEVVPLNVVEEAIIANRVDLNGPGEARRLAQILGVDVVVVGAVTDFSEWYPPRVGLRVEWYAANPGFHEIPAGYGLPWGTPEEEFIPDSLVYESQMALARAEMAALTPDCDSVCAPLPAPPPAAPAAISPSRGPTLIEEREIEVEEHFEERAEMQFDQTTLKVLDDYVQQASAVEELPRGNAAARTGSTSATGASRDGDAIAPIAPGCPTAGCQTLQPLSAARPPCIPNDGPVLSHTNIYNGADRYVTQALEGYVFFRDDARIGGWQSYLKRSDDYVRFCCHMHISEMLSARGGSRKTRVVWQWPERR